MPEAGIEVQALDNFLGKLGVGMGNERLIPSEATMRDARRFVSDRHARSVYRIADQADVQPNMLRFSAVS